jgi:hypothetical protein
MARTVTHGMTGALVASAMLAAFVSYADDLQALREAAGCYVSAMKAVLNLPKAADCPEICAKADDYATSKVAYYKAARQAMPSLVQMIKGDKTDKRYGEDLIELLDGFGDEEDEEATVILMSKLRECETSYQLIQVRKAVEDAKRVAEQFLKDFGRLEGA